MAPQFAARPSSSAGYWRGGMSDGPLSYGQGSGYGQPNQGIGILPPGSGAQGGGAWSPTLTYLLIFVAVEMIAVKCLEKWLS